MLLYNCLQVWKKILVLSVSISNFFDEACLWQAHTHTHYYYSKFNYYSKPPIYLEKKEYYMNRKKAKIYYNLSLFRFIHHTYSLLSWKKNIELTKMECSWKKLKLIIILPKTTAIFSYYINIIENYFLYHHHHVITPLKHRIIVYKKIPEKKEKKMHYYYTTALL